MTFPKHEQFPTRDEFDAIYAPYGERTETLNNTKLQIVVYTHGGELYPALTGLQLFFSDGKTFSPIFGDEDILERDAETRSSIEIGPEQEVGYIQMKVKDNRSFTGIRLIDRDGNIIVEEDGKYFGG